MKRTKAVLLFLGMGYLAFSTGMSTPALAKDDHCDEKTLKGTYVFTQDGFENRKYTGTNAVPAGTPTWQIAADRRPFGYAGREKYDGHGNVDGINTLGTARGANPSATQQSVVVTSFAEYSGTYTVNPDCTAVVIVADNPDPNDPPDPNEPVFVSKYHLFLAPNGEKFTFVVFSAATASGGVFSEDTQDLTGTGVAYRVDR